MAEKGFAGRAMNAAYHLRAVADIIKALLNGGWAAAGLKVLKHYWPQVLAIALVIIFIPIIVMCCIPMTMFGFSDSYDSQLSEMNVKAQQVSGYFDTYDQDYSERVELIESGIQNYIDSGYTYTISGDDLPKDWFIALFSVYVGNDFTNVREEQVKAFYGMCVDFQVIEPKEEQTSGCVVLIKKTPELIMQDLNFTDGDREWAQSLYKTLETEGNNG